MTSARTESYHSGDRLSGDRTGDHGAECFPLTVERVMDIGDIANELLTDERWAAQQVVRQHGQGGECKHCEARGCLMLAWARGVLGGGARAAYPQVESVKDPL